MDTTASKVKVRRKGVMYSKAGEIQFPFECDNRQDLDVQLIQEAVDCFTVRYGKQVKGGLSEGECLGNARLIAAAPSLLAALRECVNAPLTPATLELVQKAMLGLGGVQ